MSPRRIANLCCRVIAVLALFDALGDFRVTSWSLALVAIYDTAAWWTYVLATLNWATPIVQVALAGWLWWKAGLVAAWMTGHDLEDGPDEPDASAHTLTPAALATIAFAGLGVWLLIEGATALVTIVAAALFSIEAWPTGAGGPLAVEAAVSVIDVILHLGAGSILLFGARRLASVLFRGRPPVSPPVDPVDHDDEQTGDSGPDPLAARLMEAKRHRRRRVLPTGAILGEAA
jgi:hypothetical protein